MDELDYELDLDIEEKDYYQNDKFLVKKVHYGEIVPIDGVIYDKHRRFYIEDLTERDYKLENTSPYQLMLNDKVIENTSWGDLLKDVMVELITEYPGKKEGLLSFSCAWSKAKIFSNSVRTNFKEIESDLFLNTNHTALHSCWLLQDLLKFFEVDLNKVCLLIHRPCSAEPKEITLKIRKEFIEKFTKYLIDKTSRDESFTAIVINSIEKYLNPILRKISNSYTDFFLFDSYYIAFNYFKKVRTIIIRDTYSDKLQKSLKYCLNELNDFYKHEKY